MMIPAEVDMGVMLHHSIARSFWRLKWNEINFPIALLRAGGVVNEWHHVYILYSPETE